MIISRTIKDRLIWCNECRLTCQAATTEATGAIILHIPAMSDHGGAKTIIKMAACSPPLRLTSTPLRLKKTFLGLYIQQILGLMPKPSLSPAQSYEGR